MDWNKLVRDARREFSQPPAPAEAETCQCPPDFETDPIIAAMREYCPKCKRPYSRPGDDWLVKLLTGG